jgi:hypothetical protein
MNFLKPEEQKHKTFFFGRGGGNFKISSFSFLKTVKHFDKNSAKRKKKFLRKCENNPNFLS